MSTAVLTAAGAVAEGSASKAKRLETQAIEDMKKTFSMSSVGFRLWVGFLVLVILAAASAYFYQVVSGLKVTGMRDYVSWGMYMTNFVFFIGISHAGTLISAILRVTNAPWRRPITRMAEAITLFALMIGAPMVFIDMGRPDRVLNVFLHGRLNSPILWDILSITTYISGSLLYLYVALIPDLALFADRLEAPWQKKLFRVLSLGYGHSPAQEKALNRALGAICIVIIPVAVSVHTVVSWIFAMTLRPGWHSTIFGPYFVVGAIFSGTAAIITAMICFRRAYGLQRYLTMVHFKALSKLLIALNALYIYFTVNEYLTIWYGRHEIDHRLMEILTQDQLYGPLWWFMWVLCLFLPLLMTVFFVSRPSDKSPLWLMFIATVLVNIGMYVKRYLIIVPTMQTPFIPAEAADLSIGYAPTTVEWVVTTGGFAMFFLLYTLFSKVFPIISVAEVVEGIHEVGEEKVGVEV
jgi:Ni/Fe-hydrogenase subunit HybB-like protein